jgi:cell division protein DivIC
VPKVASPYRIGTGLLVLFLLPVLAYAAYSIGDRWYHSYTLALEEEGLRSEIAQLRRDNLRLQSELTAVRSDEYIESVAREQLGLVKPGDRPFAVIAPPPAATPELVSRRDPTPEPEPTGWRKLLDALFGP